MMYVEVFCDHAKAGSVTSADWDRERLGSCRKLQNNFKSNEPMKRSFLSMDFFKLFWPWTLTKWLCHAQLLQPAGTDSSPPVDWAPPRKWRVRYAHILQLKRCSPAYVDACAHARTTYACTCAHTHTQFACVSKGALLQNTVIASVADYFNPIHQRKALKTQAPCH
eukprot:1150457-Pelagomonas_calceolata.AAC.3